MSKIAIYTIAKNEEQFAKRFIDSCAEADVVVVADTGSTDKTVEILKDNGAMVHSITVDPWRFDVARNMAMDFIPEDVDICVSIDLDEIIRPGWRECLEMKWPFDNKDLVHGQYLYYWSPSQDISFMYDKLHSRKGFRWKGPCHEVLYSGVHNHTIKVPEMVVEHYPDPQKSRAQYTPLLQLAVKEEPNNDRMRHYLARAYMYERQWIMAIQEFKIHLQLPTSVWGEERAASMRFLGRCYEALGDNKEAMKWYMNAVIESPKTREPWMELADFARKMKDWTTSYWAAIKALEVTERTNTYITDGKWWGWLPHDAASVAAWYMGYKEDSKMHAKIAYKMNPSDPRLKQNCLINGIPEETLNKYKNE